jgi:hypothetical protein
MDAIPDYLLASISQADADAALVDWRWLIGDEKFAVLVTAAGDVFLSDFDGAFYWLEAGDGRLTRIGDSADDVGAALIESAENRINWFLEPVIDRLRAAGIVLAEGQCYGYTTLPILGGAYEGDNRVPIPVKEHLGLTGHIHKQIKDLPDGTQIRLKFT